MLYLLAVVLVIAGLFVTLLWAFQRRLLYLPLGGRPPAASVALPGAEDVSFRTDDGLRLAGWFLLRNADAATVLVFNGNAGNRGYRTELGGAIHEAGYNVLLFDYRGYGGNPGSPHERGLKADARAARAYLLSRGDLDPARLVYLGESLGAAVAVGLAEQSPPAALVLRSPFASLEHVARFHFPFLPVRLLLRERYPSVETAPGLTCPLLVIAGERDRVVPLESSRLLFEAAPPPKRWLAIPAADHNDPGMTDGDLWIDAMSTFLEEHRLGPAGSVPAAGMRRD